MPKMFSFKLQLPQTFPHVSNVFKCPQLDMPKMFSFKLQIASNISKCSQLNFKNEAGELARPAEANDVRKSEGGSVSRDLGEKRPHQSIRW